MFVYNADAAMRRAGMLRVYSTEQLFDAVETLARARPLHGERLAMMTNGGGLGVMATDAPAERYRQATEILLEDITVSDQAGGWRAAPGIFQAPRSAGRALPDDCLAPCIAAG